MADFTPTDEQIAVIDAIKNRDQVSVSAFAGAGKTTVLAAGSAAAPNTRFTYTAFNRKPIEDARGKFGRHVRLATTHSLATGIAHSDGGWRWKRMKAPMLRGRPLANHLRINDPITVNKDWTFHPSRLAFLATKMVERFTTSADEDLGWWHLPGDIIGVEKREDRKLLGEALIPAARRAWQDMTSKHGVLPYTHNAYRKEWALTHPRIDGDVLLIDEAQDSAGVLIGVALDQIKHGLLVVPVGDPYQAINEWAGAKNAMDKFGGRELRLTQSFRFGQAVADAGNAWLEVLGAPARIRGFDRIESRVTSDMTPDAVLFRTNAAAVEAVMNYQAEGARVALLGSAKEVIDLNKGARALKEGNWTPHWQLTAFKSWGEVQSYVEAGEADDLKVFVDLVDKHGVDSIDKAMHGLVDPKFAEVTLSTAHKCKGSEWPNVRIGGDFRKPKPDEYGEVRVSAEAARLAYVAVTRAQRTLDRGSLSFVDELVAATTPPAAPEPTAPAPVVVAPEPSTCGAEHRAYGNVYCEKDQHGDDVLHESSGVSPWGPSLTRQPAHV